MLISHNLLYKSDTFLTSPATEQLRMTDSISKVSSCCSVLEKTNLIMTHGFFTTSFMLPGLICRSLEICAYSTCKETQQLISWRMQHFCITTIYIGHFKSSAHYACAASMMMQLFGFSRQLSARLQYRTCAYWQATWSLFCKTEPWNGRRN